MRKRPTIIDVAEAAGVSKSTVSLVLRENPAVRPETRELVRQTMAALGYVYNRAAAQMRQADAGLIGLVINDLRNPFFTEFATSAQMALSRGGYATVIANTDEDPKLQAQVVASMIEHGVAGLVISPTYGDPAATLDPIERSGTPTLQVLRQVDQRGTLFPFASFDYVIGGRLATEHLLNAGARRIAFVGGLVDWPITRERMAGYLAVLGERGHDPVVLHGRPSRAFGRAAAQHVLACEPKVDAVLCFNDLVALGLLAGLAQAGRCAGADLLVVGFDDIEESREASPPLSSVRCDIAGFGQWAAESMIAWLRNGATPLPERREPVQLICRESSRRPHTCMPLPGETGA